MEYGTKLNQHAKVGLSFCKGVHVWVEGEGEGFHQNDNGPSGVYSTWPIGEGREGEGVYWKYGCMAIL